jgi:phage terminase large subunit
MPARIYAPRGDVARLVEHAAALTRARSRARPARPDAGAVYDDPALFGAGVLGHDYWETQLAILEALAEPRARVVVKACHASSKTFTASSAVLWWMARGGLAITTAPGWPQVRDVLWPEIHRQARTSLHPLGYQLLQTEARAPGGGHALGLSTDEGVRFQGFHGDVLLVFDEAPGIRADIWTAAEGISASGDVRWLVLGNPTLRGGPFEALFATPGVTAFTIDAFDTPNLAGLSLAELLALDEPQLDQNPRPYLVSRRWVYDRYYEWGEDSAEWMSRVRGEFPDQGVDALIAARWIGDAYRRVFGPPLPDWVVQAGLDVAGPGEDETVLSIRHGPKLVAQHAWHEADTLRLLGAIRAALAPYARELFALCVDAIGIGYHLGGALVADYGNRVVQVNVGVPSRFPGRFANLKAELYWGLRERFSEGDIGGDFDAVTQSQLASLRYHHTLRGLIEIESKEEARKRGVRSPDRAESLMLAYAPIAEALGPTDYQISWR